MAVVVRRGKACWLATGLATAAYAMLASTARAADRPEAASEDPAARIIVTGRQTDLTGIAASANQGEVSAADLALRPVLRPGEIVEQIPGVIITQHSGSGKANQYFLRGFNLDHGTDLSISVDGVPVNLPTHAHGQGYADLNFLIPELVERVEYKKGPYYADVGDFGSAGAFAIRYFNRLPEAFALGESGQYGYGRALVAGNSGLGADNLVYAVQFEHDDGPWQRGDDARKLAGVLRWSGGSAAQGFAVTASAYHNVWNSTDQVPQRAIGTLIDRFGTIDPSDGGNTGRYALSGEWHRTGADSSTRIGAYALRYDLDLFSNFTYFLNDPVRGDQIEQTDRRWIIGANVRQEWRHRLLGAPTTTTLGFDLRRDVIDNGLFSTQARRRFATTTLDHVNETSAAPWFQAETRWTPWLRTIVGLRSDTVWMDVIDKAGDGSGQVSHTIVSPKIALAFGPFAKTEIYLNYGQGFHSNDARGVLIRIDPATALPRSSGEEIGLRTTLVPHLRSEVSLWRLHLASELVWAGDAGTNEPSGPTTRWGVELANWYTPTPWLTIDADFAWSRARFTDHEPAGDYVPEALEATFDGGLALHDLPGRLAPWSAGLRLRYFGPRPLTQDNTVRSQATTLVYANLGYRLSRRVTLGLDVFNLFDARTNDIDYYYTSRLPGEPLAGVDDVHTHPSDPREVRVSLKVAL